MIAGFLLFSGATGGVLYKTAFLKISQISQETPVLESLFINVAMQVQYEYITSTIKVFFFAFDLQIFANNLIFARLFYSIQKECSTEKSVDSKRGRM